MMELALNLNTNAERKNGLETLKRCLALADTNPKNRKKRNDEGPLSLDEEGDLSLGLTKNDRNHHEKNDRTDLSTEY